MLNTDIVLSSAGSLSVAVIALFFFVFQGWIYLKGTHFSWSKWGALLSLATAISALRIRSSSRATLRAYFLRSASARPVLSASTDEPELPPAVSVWYWTVVPLRRACSINSLNYYSMQLFFYWFIPFMDSRSVTLTSIRAATI